MKKVSYLIAMLAIVAVIGVPGFSQQAASNGGILTMRTIETWNGIYDNSITIVYENGSVEKTELKRLRIGDMSQNLTIINEHLNKIQAKGYDLVSTAGGGADGIIITTYTFKKTEY